MKKLSMLLMLSLVMTIGSHRVFAQSVTVTLMPGWNWISSPTMDTLDFETAMGSFTPAVGDIIRSQWGSATYVGGQWRGNISQFYPGYGYKYKSSRTMPAFLTFNAQQPAPQVIVTTMEPTDITTNSATCGGNVTSSDGNYVFVILRGICWSTNPNPTFNDNYVEVGNGLGSFTLSLTELTPNTTYYVRTFAVTPNGTFYGDEISLHTQTWINGILPGAFSVSANQQVYFSQGNLQYQASTNTWKFADNQYDYVGDSNSSISSTFEGWIDLFGWGTSGYHDSNDPYNVNFQPWSTSVAAVNSSYNFCGYGPSTNMTDPNLTGTSANYDWGIYNPISNGGNAANQWRTLTSSEWDYIINTRITISGIRYAKVQLNNVNGIVLLPDDWDTSIYSLSNTNTDNASFDCNIISAVQWTIFENAGAVFLPVTGERYEVSIDKVNTFGGYWSASYSNRFDARYLSFCNGYLHSIDHGYLRSIGRSVRLVCSLE